MDEEWEFWEHNYNGDDTEELSRGEDKSNSKQLQGILEKTNKSYYNDQKILEWKKKYRYKLQASRS